jgi:hypothetical protein
MNSVTQFIKPLNLYKGKSFVWVIGFNIQNKLQFSFLFLFIIS